MSFFFCFQRTFHYGSVLWSNNYTYNRAGGQTGFDQTQTKLPTYWNTSFSKICLGMMIHNQSNFVVIKKRASSLYSLIADGKYRATSLGSGLWKTLIGFSASLQSKCKKEGFNTMSTWQKTYSKARIGILGDHTNFCRNSNTRIGFGTGGKPDDFNTCGNAAAKTHIKAMGYILVQ